MTCSACRVSPFRHPRIKAHVQLPAAFRSLSRLSSAPSARASALRPTMLNLFVSPPLPFRFTRAVQKWFLHTSAGESAACVPLFFSLACYCFLDFADLSTAHPSILLVSFSPGGVEKPRCTSVQLRFSPCHRKKILRTPDSSLVSSSLFVSLIRISSINDAA